jgi:hypothetical protein
MRASPCGESTWSTIATIPCSSIRFTLTVSDTTISGNGSFSVEAGRGGTLTVTGASSGTLRIGGGT